MAIIGMDIHRSFAQAAFLQDGQVKREQRVDLTHHRLIRLWEVALGRGQGCHRGHRQQRRRRADLATFRQARGRGESRMVRAIAYARVKTDKIDAVILARLHAGGFLPEVWVADDNTQR